MLIYINYDKNDKNDDFYKTYKETIKTQLTVSKLKQPIFTNIIKDNINTIFTVPSELGSQPLPWFSHKVPAGFPSPADDHVEKRLDLNDYLIAQKEATFFVSIKGDSMIDASIHDGDIVIVDRSKDAKIGDIVLASIDGEFTVKTLAKHLSHPRLLPANSEYKYIDITEGMVFEIWGVVTGAVRKFK